MFKRVIRRLYFIPLVLAFIILVMYTTPAIAQEEKEDKITKVGIVVSTCKSIEAVKGLAEMDKESDADARNLFRYLMYQGKCGRLPQPTLMPLDELLGEYEDSEGEIVQIWKIYKLEHWSLVRKKFISDEKGNKVNEITI